MTRRGIWLVVAVGFAVFAGVSAAMLTLRASGQCAGPALKLTIDADGLVTFDGRRLQTQKDMAVTFFAAAEKSPQPSITVSTDRHASERTIGVVVTLARTAGLKCVSFVGSDDYSGV